MDTSGSHCVLRPLDYAIANRSVRPCRGPCSYVPQLKTLLTSLAICCMIYKMSPGLYELLVINREALDDCPYKETNLDVLHPHYARFWLPYLLTGSL